MLDITSKLQYYGRNNDKRTYNLNSSKNTRTLLLFYPSTLIRAFHTLHRRGSEPPFIQGVHPKTMLFLYYFYMAKNIFYVYIRCWTPFRLFHMFTSDPFNKNNLGSATVLHTLININHQYLIKINWYLQVFTKTNTLFITN